MPTINFIPTVTIPRVPNIVIPNQTSLPNTTHITRTLPPIFDTLMLREKCKAFLLLYFLLLFCVSGDFYNFPLIR